MQTTTDISRRMLNLRVRYSMPIDSTFKHSIREYQRCLGSYPIAVLNAVMGDNQGDQIGYAHTRYPQYFPTAAQLDELCKIESKRTHYRDLSVPASRQIEAPSDRVPSTPQAQEEYINAAPNPFERLGRYWACESKSLRIPPDNRTPDDVRRRRWDQFWQTWEQYK